MPEYEEEKGYDSCLFLINGFADSMPSFHDNNICDENHGYGICGDDHDILTK